MERGIIEINKHRRGGAHVTRQLRGVGPVILVGWGLRFKRESVL